MSVGHTSLDKLIQRIMIDAQDLIKCARCNVYVFDSTRSDQVLSPYSITPTFTETLPRGSFGENRGRGPYESPPTYRNGGVIEFVPCQACQVSNHQGILLDICYICPIAIA